MFWIPTVRGGIMHPIALGDFRPMEFPKEFSGEARNRAEAEIILARRDIGDAREAHSAGMAAMSLSRLLFKEFPSWDQATFYGMRVKTVEAAAASTA